MFVFKLFEISYERMKREGDVLSTIYISLFEIETDEQSHSLFYLERNAYGFWFLDLFWFPILRSF